MALVQLAEPAHQKPAEGLRRRQTNHTLDAIVAATDLPLDGKDRPLGFLSPRQYPGARFRKDEAIRRAREQADRQGRLERVETPADGRMADFEAARGAGKSSCPADSQKVAEVVPVEAVQFRTGAAPASRIPGDGRSNLLVSRRSCH